MVQVAAAAEEPENPFEFCGKQLKCGHACKGVHGEGECLPCLEQGCIESAIKLFEDFMKQPELQRKGSNPPRRSISIRRESREKRAAQPLDI